MRSSGQGHAGRYEVDHVRSAWTGVFRGGAGSGCLSVQAHHAGGAVLGRRPDRCGVAGPWPGHVEGSGTERCRGEQARRRRHGGGRIRGAGAARRLHHPDPSQWHGDGAGAVQEALLQPDEGLRVHRAGGGCADDAAGPQGPAAGQRGGADQVCVAEQGEGLAGQCRPWRGFAAMRPAVRGGSQSQDDFHSLPGHRPRADGLAGRAGGPAVRPDHLDAAAYQCQPGQAVWRDDA
ncbi:hypothetical protein D3C72_1367460 [compost metagenome]